jgi:hypothetical protein
MAAFRPAKGLDNWYNFPVESKNLAQMRIEE